MDESALLRYFDKFIANDSYPPETEKVEVKEEQDEEQGEEEFFSSLPDELLYLNKDNTENCSGLDHNSQNSTAAAAARFPGGSSMLELGVRLKTLMMPETLQPKMLLQIHNVMSSVNLGSCPDLTSISHTMWNVEYKSKSCLPLIMRIRKPRTTGLFYKSGKMICLGSKSEAQSWLAARRFARKMQKLGFPARFLNFRIHNLLATCTTFPINVMRLALHQRCSYVQEIFPAVHYKVTPRVTATIASSGKISLTGGNSEAEIQEAFNILYPILSRFRK